MKTGTIVKPEKWLVESIAELQMMIASKRLKHVDAIKKVLLEYQKELKELRK